MVVGRNWLSSAVLVKPQLRAATTVMFDPALRWKIVWSALWTLVTRTNEYSQTDVTWTVWRSSAVSYWLLAVNSLLNTLWGSYIHTDRMLVIGRDWSQISIPDIQMRFVIQLWKANIKLILIFWSVTPFLNFVTLPYTWKQQVPRKFSYYFSKIHGI